MRALLILNAKNGNMRIVVKLVENRIRRRVIGFLEENRTREAFDLIKREAEVEAYLPAGTRLSVSPQVTLVEDLL